MHWKNLILGLAGLASAGCEPEQDLPLESASASGSVSSAAPAASSVATTSAAIRGADEISPVYPKDNLPPEPLAVRFCAAVHAIPSERRAKCCDEPPRAAAQSECVRTLSVALRSKAISLEETALKRCEEASERAFQGCAWVGVATPSAADECVGILQGTVAAGAVCRSSLECTGNLRCYGLGATQPGRCVTPRPAGAVCGIGIDTLAGLTGQDTFELAHPECEGSCFQRRCRAPTEVGKACKVSVDCGAGRSCKSGLCSADALPAAGSACAEGECARGLRCIEGKCAKALLAGEACKSDVECTGACENGKCAQLCRRAMPRDLVPRRGPGDKKEKPTLPR